MSNQGISLVFDIDFGVNLEGVCSNMPVWVRSSDKNKQLVEMIRNTNKNSEITIFFDKSNEGIDDFFFRILSSVDEHHGELSESGGYKKVFVYGLSISDTILKHLKSFGLNKIQITDGVVFAEKI